MILDVINKTFKPLLLIAIVSFIGYWALGLSTQMITEYTTSYGIKIYRMDLDTYLRPLSNIWDSAPNIMNNFLPPKQFANSWDWGQNLLIALNWAIIFPINLPLWIFRMVSWLATMFLAIIGWDVENSQLINILIWIANNMSVPYFNI